MNTYELITQKVIESLEKGVAPWHKPWNSDSGFISYATGTPYSALNTLLLLAQDGQEGEYLTWKQIKEAKGTLKKGSKSKVVCFYTFVEKKVTTAEGKEEEERYPVIKWYNVFNLLDCEGIEPKYTKLENDTVGIDDADKVAEDYCTRTGVKLCKDGKSNDAYYSPAQDKVVVPCISQYKEASEYYSTLYHELTHSTMTKDRCNRITGESKQVARGDDYSREELVAELGSAMSLGLLGIENKSTFRNSVAYLKGWADTLEKDSHAIVWAASRAEKAVKFIFNKEQ